MPNGGNKRGIAAGVTLAADNFYKNFIAARQMKEQNKYRKLEPVIGVIMSHINSPDITMDERMAAIDSLPHVLGIKNQDIPLSKQLGLDRFAEEQVDTGETKNVNARTKQLKPVNSTMQAQGPGLGNESVEVNEPELNLQGTQEAAILKRRGGLTDSDLKLSKQLKLVSHNRLLDFDMEKQKMVLQAELQDRVLTKQGWEKDGDWVLDTEKKTWQRQWTNPRSKETFMQTLPPDVVPESIIKEREKNKGGGKDSIIIRGLTDFYTSQGNDVETARALALKDFHDNYSAGTEFKKQGVTGTRATDIRGNQSLNLQELGIQQKHGELVASASASETNVASLAQRKGVAWQNAANAKNDFDKIKEDFDVDEKEYQTAQNAYNKATDDANRLETEYQTALKSHKTLTEQVGISQQNLNSSGISPTGQNRYSAKMLARIKLFKQKNPSAQLSDDQIAEILKQKGYKD